MLVWLKWKKERGGIWPDLNETVIVAPDRLQWLGRGFIKQRLNFVLIICPLSTALGRKNVHLFEHVRIIISLGASASGEGYGCKERVRKREKRTNPSLLFSPSSLGVLLRYSSRCTKAVQLLISKIIQCLPVSPQELPLGAQAPSSLCKTTSLPWLQVAYSRPKIHSVPEHKKIVANKDLKVILPLDYKTFFPN